MKIRTDFVTNSSSSSFVRVLVKTERGKFLEGGFENTDGFVYGKKTFSAARDSFLNGIKSGDDLINAAEKWFENGLDGDDADDYEYGDTDEIRRLGVDQISSVNFQWGCNSDDDWFEKEYSYIYKGEATQMDQSDDDLIGDISYAYYYLCFRVEDFEQIKQSVFNKIKKKGYDLSMTSDIETDVFFNTLGLYAPEIDDEYISIEGEMEDDEISDMKFPYIELLKTLAPYCIEDRIGSIETENCSMNLFVKDGKIVFEPDDD